MDSDKASANVDSVYVSLVARNYTSRLLVAFVLILNLLIHYMNLKNAYLNGELDAMYT